MKKDIFGLKIDDISIPEIVKIVERWLKKSGKHFIVTPNPEIVVMAIQDKELKNIINKADLAIPDGAGLRLSGDIVCNSPGIDVMEGLIKSAADWGFAVGLLGGKDGIAEEAAKRLRKKHPKLKMTFAISGGEIDEEGNSKEHKVSSMPHTDLLFVAFGPPKQEKWIAKNLDKLDIKLAMGVGGAFDVISGAIPRAPQWVRNLGMEWLFRLIIQPWRIKRQLALLKYLYLVFTQRKV